MFKDIKVALADPKFLHTFFESGLPWAILLATLFYALCQFLIKDSKAIAASLILLALSGLLVWPVQHYRERAKPIAASSATAVKDQSFRRHEMRWVFYGLSGLAAAAIFLGRPERGATGKLVIFLTLAGGFAACSTGLWLQYKEAQIFYPDLYVTPQR